MIPQQHKMELLSKAYVSAVTAMADIINVFHESDYGIDGTLRINGIGERKYRATGFTIDYQLKSTMNMRIVNGIIKYDLEIKNYNDFIFDESATPKILIVYYFPDGEIDWVHVNKDFLLMQKCAWWVSGKDWKPTENTSKVTVDIPREQIFDMQAQKFLSEKCRKGESI